MLPLVFLARKSLRRSEASFPFGRVLSHFAATYTSANDHELSQAAYTPAQCGKIWLGACLVGLRADTTASWKSITFFSLAQRFLSTEGNTARRSRGRKNKPALPQEVADSTSAGDKGAHSSSSDEDSDDGIHGASDYEPQASIRAHKYARLLADRAPQAEAKVQELCQVLQCPPESASKVLRKVPALITMAPGVLQQRFDSMLQFLRVAPAELRKGLVREPQVLCSQPDTLERNFELLLELPGADRQGMAEAVTGSFMVLRRGPKTVVDKVNLMSEELGITPEVAVKVLLPGRSGTVSSLSTSTLQQKLQRIKQAVKDTPWSPADILIATPRLLALNVETVASNFTMVHTAASSHPKWQQSWLKYSAGSVARTLVCSPEILRRVTKVVAAGCQERYTISTLVRLDKERWESFSEDMDEMMAPRSVRAKRQARVSRLKAQRERADGADGPVPS